MPNDVFTSLSGPQPSPLAPGTHCGEAGTSLLPRQLYCPSPPIPWPPSTGQPGAPNPPSHLLWCVGSAGALLPPRPVGKLGPWLPPAL